MALKKPLYDKDGNLVYPEVGIDLDEVVYAGDPEEVASPSPWIETTDIKDSAITTAKVADGAITNVKIANSTIQSGKINWTTIFTDGLDTGWVSATSYINTTYFSARDSSLFSYRILCGVVYWRGELYCHTAPNSSQVNILQSLPEKIRSSGQVNIYGSQYELSNSEYTIWTESDHMVLKQIKQNIPATNNYKGYNFGQMQYISRSMTS